MNTSTECLNLFIVCSLALQTTYNNSLHCFEPQQSGLPKILIVILQHQFNHHDLLYLSDNSKTTHNICPCHCRSPFETNLLFYKNYQKYRNSEVWTLPSFYSSRMPGNIWKERKRKKTPRLEAIGIYTFAGENNNILQYFN